MKDYTSPSLDYKDKIKFQGEKLFYKTWDNSSEAFEILLKDETISKKVLVQQHVNPLNEQLEDRKLICLDKDLGSLTWGSVISGYEANEKHLVITQPYSNGVYSICKIRRLKNNVSFSINDIMQNYSSILADSLLYTDKSYTSDDNVFDEEDKKALVLPYDNTTKLIKMFDEITVDDVEYKIVQIDNVTMKEYDEEFGVLQLVLLSTNFGSLKLTLTDTLFVGILRFARLKERIFNSLGREILSSHGVLNTGDYISQSFLRGDIQENRTYIIRSRIDKRLKYDSTFVIECQNNVKILDDDGITIHNYPMFFQDNKSRPGLSERSETGITENSTFQSYVRYDSISRRFIDVTGKTASGKSNKITRVLIDGIAYKLTGDDALTMGFNGSGLITLGLEKSVTDSNDNLELGIADYWNNVAQTPPTDLIVGDADLWIGDTNTYNIITNNTVTWGLTDNSVIATLGLTSKNGECTVTCANNTALIGKTVTLTATLDTGTKYTKTIIITSRI